MLITIKNLGWIKIGFLITWALYLSSCAQLPDYAQPKFYNDENTTGLPSSGFSYRELKIEDFEEESLPPEYQQYHSSLNARSCLSIRPSNRTKARISEVPYYETQLYAGNFTQISFEALFIPSCSWWNHKTAQKRIAYVLEHEQIHFALSELTARKITEEMKQAMKDYTALGSTHAEVAEVLMKTLQNVARDMIEKELQTHIDFDEQTSMFFDPSEQSAWLNKISGQLAPEGDAP